MFKLLTALICFSWLVTSSFAALAPFIEKCKWNDKACLIKSTQIAIPIFAAGIPDLGLPPLDPMVIKELQLNQAGLNILFKDMTITGTKNCNTTNIERNIDEKWIKIEMDCPIDVRGSYVGSGAILAIPVEGNGPMHVQTDKLHMNIKCELTTVDGKDGQKHWQSKTRESSYEFIDKTLINFENLFNGDQEKAGPVLAILNQSWKEIIQTFAKPIVDEVIRRILENLAKFYGIVPASELEL